MTAAWLGAAVDHVGIAVPDIDRAAGLYRDAFGAAAGTVLHLPEQGIAVVFVEMRAVRLELIAPIGAVSPVAHVLGRHTIQDFLAARPEGGLHHICYAVDDLAAAVARAQGAGLRPIGSGKPIVGASGRPILFLDPAGADGVLIELKGPVIASGV